MVRACIVLIIFGSCARVDEGKDTLQLFLPEDLEASLWAKSPMFYNPTNIDVDHRNRVWVTEAVNYRNYNNDSTRILHHQDGDRVVILEDTDADGKADRSKVFVQDKDLVSPLGIAVIGSKIYVSCSPHLIVYTDNDGDDLPDDKEIFLTGFGGLDHDHSLHAVVAGPDGNLYFNTGNAGPHEVTDKDGWTLRSGSIYTGGSPYNTRNNGNRKSDDGRIWVGGLALRIQTDGTGLKVLGHNFRNAYELAIDSRGDLWQNDNDDQVVACRTTWLMEGGNAGYFSTDGTRYWQADQRPGQDVFTAHWHQDDPGVMPAGDRTGAGAPSGIVLHEGDGLGEKYRGLLLSADAGRNVVFGYLPQKSGSGYNLDPRFNFVTSLQRDDPGYVWNDTTHVRDPAKWFRPSDVAIGTDGAVFVCDWYDPVVGGHQLKDSTGYGRIYRITPKGKTLKRPSIDWSTVDGQIEALRSSAIHVRRVAYDRLREQGPQVVDQVAKVLDDPNPFHRARAIWLLSQLGNKGKRKVEELLSDPDEENRITAFRAIRQVTDDILPYIEKLADDPSPFVRRELLVALSELPESSTRELIIKLVERFDGKDRWYLEAIGRAAEGNENELYEAAKRLFNADNTPARWDEKMRSLAWRLHPPSAVKDLVWWASTAAAPADRSRALTALGFINTKAAAQGMISLATSKVPDVAEQAAYWISFRRGNDWFSLADWKTSGIDTEKENKVTEMKVRLSRVVDPEMPFDEKRGNARQMARDATGGAMLLGLEAEGKLPAELKPHVAEWIFNNPDQSVRIQASMYFKKPGADRAVSAPSIMALRPNVKEGAIVFENSCGTCHRAGQTGKDIGPELTTVAKKFDKSGLLDAIINPNAGIVFGYEAWTINTSGGESLFGFLVADGAQAVVVKDLTGNLTTIPAASVSSRKKHDKSVMPEYFDLGLSDQNLADLLEYLVTLK